MNYTCFRGFELVGPEYRVCQANGEWSEEPPICRALVCDTPSIIDNGKVEGGDFRLGKTVTYSCNEVSVIFYLRIN